ncbi:hypothetical protein ABH961_003466 [Bacillus sp. RC251]
MIFYKLLSRYLWAVRPLLQNSAKAKKLGGGSTKPSLIKVSLYKRYI